MWKPPPEQGLSHILSTSPNRRQAFRVYETTGNAGELGKELFIFDHTGFHPPHHDAVRLMRHAAKSSGPGWDFLHGMRAWRNGNLDDAYSFIARAGSREPFVMAVLGFMTERGIGVSASQQRALDLYTRAGACPLALYLRADMLKRKRGIRSARRIVQGCHDDGLKCWLGDTYLHDNPAEARQLFQEASHDYGKVKLGEMYYRGSGGRTDMNKAKRLYEEACASGNSKAMCLQGIAWRQGTFGRIDLETSKQLFENAVKWNDTTAMVLLGSMYETGIGAPQDRKLALRYYKQSCDMGDSFGYLAFGKLSDGDKAREALEKASTFGNDYVRCEGLYQLGKLYEACRGIERDYTSAFKCYKRCARMGGETSVKSVVRIGYFFERGLGIGRSENTARECYVHALGNDDGEAAYRLGLLNERDGDTPSAMELFITAASSGWVDAAYRLGRLYEDCDTTTSMICLETAAKLGCIDAKVRLGRILMLGRGVEKDVERGRELLLEAREDGSARAGRVLEEIDSGHVGRKVV